MKVDNEHQQIRNCLDYFRYILNGFVGELEESDNCPANFWIAGGSIRDRLSIGYVKNDIDFFFPNAIALAKFLDRVKSYMKPEGVQELYANENVTRFRFGKYKVDLVKRFFRGPEETIAEFDFTVCCCATDFQNLYVHPEFFYDLASRRLVINKLPYPLSTLQRLQRYVKKGYTICNGGLLDIAIAISRFELNSEQNHFAFYPDGRLRFVKID